MSDNNEIQEENCSEAGSSRRDFLKKAGKFAVYTPPAVMMLMKPAHATLSKSYCARPHDGGHKFRDKLSSIKEHKRERFSNFRQKMERRYSRRDG